MHMNGRKIVLCALCNHVDVLCSTMSTFYVPCSTLSTLRVGCPWLSRHRAYMRHRAYVRTFHSVSTTMRTSLTLWEVSVFESLIHRLKIFTEFRLKINTFVNLRWHTDLKRFTQVTDSPMSSQSDSTELCGDTVTQSHWLTESQNRIFFCAATQVYWFFLASESIGFS